MTSRTPPKHQRARLHSLRLLFFPLVLALAGVVGAEVAAGGPAKQLDGCEQEFMRVVEGVRPSVVTVISYSKIGESEGEETERDAAKPLKKTIGSGVVINSEGHILTTTSVVGASRNLFIRTHDGAERSAVFLGADQETGLALLKVRPEGLAAAQLGRPGELQTGAWAIIVAESFDKYPRYAFGAFTRVVSGDGGPGGELALLQMSTQVYPGNSGGAVANANGEVVGVVVGAMSAAGMAEPEAAGGAEELAGGNPAVTAQKGMGWSARTLAASPPGPASPTLSLAVPIDRAGQVASDLAVHGSSGPGFLGLRVRTSTPALKHLLNFENGVVILEVLPMSPAEAAGIEAGDVILKFGGQPLREPAELARLVAEVRPGERRDLELLRGDVHLTRAVMISAAPIGGDGDQLAAEAERRRLRKRVEELKRELEALEGRLMVR